jgi:nucleoside-diphosphate-sugar epimerase
MAETIFLAGAAGAIGRCLIPLVLARGWRVVGTTRSAHRADALRALGVEPVVVDVYDAAMLEAAVFAARPAVVMHQLTDLTRTPGDSLEELRARNARLRDEGTRSIVAAAARAGARRLIAQSIAFAYAPGPQPYREDAPLDVAAEGGAGVNARGVESLERQVLAAPIPGLVLRYGRLWGPGTGVDAPPITAPLHVSEAARAACLALERGEAGVYNIAADDGFVDISRAARLLGWRP